MATVEKNNIIKQLVIKKADGDYLRINPESLVVAVSDSEAENSETLNQILNTKADKATTLSGYGIENAYTKAEVDAKIQGVSVSGDITEISTRVTGVENQVTQLENNKANKSTTLGGYGIDNAYTKSEIDSLIENIASNVSSTSDIEVVLLTYDSVESKTKCSKTFDELYNILNEKKKLLLFYQPAANRIFRVFKYTKSRIDLVTSFLWMYNYSTKQYDGDWTHAGIYNDGEVAIQPYVGSVLSENYTYSKSEINNLISNIESSYTDVDIIALDYDSDSSTYSCNREFTDVLSVLKTNQKMVLFVSPKNNKLFYVYTYTDDRIVLITRTRQTILPTVDGIWIETYDYGSFLNDESISITEHEIQKTGPDYSYSKTEIDNMLSSGIILPDQTGNAGKVLTTNGTTASWETPVSFITIRYY